MVQTLRCRTVRLSEPHVLRYGGGIAGKKSVAVTERFAEFDSGGKLYSMVTTSVPSPSR